ncbi:hypothetical protein QUF63_09130 [Anaerolineales bacterium HSG25]|nr:hypothetical protein [Anaerolineales bacterium HSG25]
MNRPLRIGLLAVHLPFIIHHLPFIIWFCNPKNIFNYAIAQTCYLAEIVSTGTRKLRICCDVAEQADTAMLKQRCPQGYQPLMVAVCGVGQNIIQVSHKIEILC